MSAPLIGRISVTVRMVASFRIVFSRVRLNSAQWRDHAYDIHSGLMFASDWIDHWTSLRILSQQHVSPGVNDVSGIVFDESSWR